ncbi:MAG: hypothetical protein V3W44_05075 [Dehalococcoidales bacterium]
MTEIKDAPEALRWLEELVRRGKERLAGITKEPWHMSYDQEGIPIVVANKVVLLRGVEPDLTLEEPDPRGENVELAVVASYLVPAMVKGAKRIIGRHGTVRLAYALAADPGDDDSVMAGTVPAPKGVAKALAQLRECEVLLIDIARDYQPAMVALGWTPK